MQIRLRVTVVALVTLLWSAVGYSQIGNVEDLLRGGVEDANLLIKEYLSPFGVGFGADLNNGWYSTAGTHELGGFDITVMANSAIAPSRAGSFDLSELPLENMRLSNSNVTSIAPTVVGDNEPGPDLEVVAPNPFTGNDEVIGSFQMPEGLGFRYVPSAIVQASVGLVRNTNLMVRFFPEIEINEDIGRFKMIGFGVKHELNQWIPTTGPLPVDLAVMAGFTSFQAESDLALEPDLNAVQTGANYDDQQVNLKATSFTFNFLASKQFSVLTLFGSMGFGTSNVDLNLKGNYPVTVIETDPASADFGEKVIEDFVDPVNLSFSGENNVRANFGFQLKLAVLAFHASYTVASYPVVNAGLGFSIR